ncbi:hypothetical protein EJB05_20301, partial [Eragrostis curvula]
MSAVAYVPGLHCALYKHQLWHSKSFNPSLAMASVPKLLLVALLCSYHSVVAHAADVVSTHKVLDIESMLKPKSVCSESKGIGPSSSVGGTTLPLHHRHGPCSPVSVSSKKKNMPTLEEMLERDRLRAAYIKRKFNLQAALGSSVDQQLDAATVPTTLGTDENSLEYVIRVGIGSPAVTQTVLIDTGSDVSWVQCKPCAQCHNQVDPLFDPSASSTYAPFSCGSGACAQLGQEGAGCSTSSQCQYQVQYGDGSTTTGTYSADTLTLGSSTVRNFQFGCSHVESGFDDLTDGLMGLGGGPQSLVSQTTGTFGKAFSYCLPASSDSSSGFLTLGAGTSGGFVKTPLFRTNIPTFYVVRLQAIRVGGKQLNIPPSVFSAGSIFDSGTVITQLPRAAYSALRSAFKAGMRQY